MKQSHFSVLVTTLLVILIFQVGCDTVVDSLDEATKSITDNSSDFRHLTLDEQFVIMARENPGFGGLYLDESGVVQIMTTDIGASKYSAISASITKVLGDVG